MTLDETKQYLTALEGWELKYQQREATKLREICWELLERLESCENDYGPDRERWFR